MARWYRLGMARWYRLGMMALILLVVWGCVSPPSLPTKSSPSLQTKSSELMPVKVKGNPLIADDEIVAQIKPGTTSQETVMSLIGEPDTVVISNGTKWVYHYTEIYSHNPFDLKQVMLVLLFDNKGILNPGKVGMVRMKAITIGGKKLVTYDYFTHL